MRLPLALFAAGLVGLIWLPAPARAQAAGQIEYAIDVDPDSVKTFLRQDGKRSRQVSLNFLVERTVDGVLVGNVPKDEIVIEEDGVPVAGIGIFVYFSSYKNIRYFLSIWVLISIMAFILYIDENFYVKLLLVRHAPYFVFGSALALIVAKEAKNLFEKYFQWITR